MESSASHLTDNSRQIVAQDRNRSSDSLRFNQLDQLRAHVSQLELTDAKTTGAWTAGQILYHLAAAFEASSESLSPLPPVKRFLRRLKKMPVRAFALRGFFPRGMAIPEAVRERLTPPADACALQQRIRLVNAIDTFASAQGDPPPHPVLGPLSRDEWTRFHLRHCEMHLAYIVQA